MRHTIWQFKYFKWTKLLLLYEYFSGSLFEYFMLTVQVCPSLFHFSFSTDHAVWQNSYFHCPGLFCLLAATPVDPESRSHDGWGLHCYFPPLSLLRLVNTHPTKNSHFVPVLVCLFTCCAVLGSMCGMSVDIAGKISYRTTLNPDIIIQWWCLLC